MEALKRMREFFADEVGTDRVSLKSAPMAEGPSVDRGQRLVKGMVTTTMPDMDDEVVLANFDTTYFPDRIKAVYLDHNYSTPGQLLAIGKCARYSIRGKGMWAQTYIADSALGEDVLTAVEAEILTGMSIGFRVLDEGPPDHSELSEYGDNCKNVIRHSKLLEYSFTAMPANPGALIRLDDLTKSGEIRRKSAVLMGLPTTAKRKFHPVSEPQPPRRQIVLGSGGAWVRNCS